MRRPWRIAIWANAVLLGLLLAVGTPTIPGACVAGWYGCQTVRSQDILDELPDQTTWEGTWSSNDYADGGEIRMRMDEAVPGQYRTVWQVEHHGVFEAGFDEVLQITPSGSVSGEIDLGPQNGGTYRVRGWIGIGEMSLEFDGSMDSGVIEMTPCGEQKR